MTRPRHRLLHHVPHRNLHEMELQHHNKTPSHNGRGTQIHRGWEYRSSHRLRHPLVPPRTEGNADRVQEVVKIRLMAAVAVRKVSEEFHRVLDMLKGMRIVRMEVLTELQPLQHSNVSFSKISFDEFTNSSLFSVQNVQPGKTASVSAVPRTKMKITGSTQTYPAGKIYKVFFTNRY